MAVSTRLRYRCVHLPCRASLFISECALATCVKCTLLEYSVCCSAHGSLITRPLCVLVASFSLVLAEISRRCVQRCAAEACSLGRTGCAVGPAAQQAEASRSLRWHPETTCPRGRRRLTTCFSEHVPTVKQHLPVPLHSVPRFSPLSPRLLPCVPSGWAVAAAPARASLPPRLPDEIDSTLRFVLLPLLILTF